MPDNPLESLVGKDKRANIRLNKKKLELEHGKDYAAVVFFGDLHLGHPSCDIKKAKHNLDFALEHRMYILGMGDLIEAGLRSSIGDSVYQQNLNPHEQIDQVTELLKPMADAGLILGLHQGNHCERITKATGVNPMKIICRYLKVPYLGSACWNLFKVGMQNYTVYSMHGSTGSRYVYTKLKALVDIAHNFDADVLSMGHVHEIAQEAITTQTLDLRSKTIVERKKYLILTGHYLRYDDTYAQTKGYPMGKTGSPNIKFEQNRHGIHFRD